MTQPVLVVEDDQMISQLIKVYLEKEGFHVIEASDGETAKRLFLQEAPFLVILDLMLPKISGEQICHWIRNDLNDQSVAIIMLTAKSQTLEKINGLKIGADHYVTKPFNPDELMAHVGALLRRTNQMTDAITLNGITIIPNKAQVFLHDEPITLTKIEFKLLHVLMHDHEVVFSREQLVEALYETGERNILDRTIDAHIKKLREKIEETPSKPQRIKTKRGMGYVFV